jgi:hypothetical protein
LIMNLNRAYPNNLDYVVETVYRIFHAHYLEEYKRKVVLPEEWSRLQREGKAEVRKIKKQGGRQELTLILVEADDQALPGFLRSVRKILADVVVQKRLSGHINVITRQGKEKLDLRRTVAIIRRLEAKRRGLGLQLKTEELVQSGRLDDIKEWYYDTVANTIQNGGAAAEGIPPTKLTLAEIGLILEKTLV